MTFQKTLTTAIAVAAIYCFTISDRMDAATTAGTTITYAASGTFAATALNGADTLKLAGEPFTVTIAVSSATPPTKTGPNWALYTKLRLTGSVNSGLLGPTPVPIVSGGASIEQLIAAGKYDSFVMAAPIRVVGLSLTINATIQMPLNTITKPLLHPFNPVSLVPSNATVVYSDGTNSTTLAIQTGTLTATIPAATSQSAVLQHPAAAVGTQMARLAVGAPVELELWPDAVTLKFYASRAIQA